MVLRCLSPANVKYSDTDDQDNMFCGPSWTRQGSRDRGVSQVTVRPEGGLGKDTDTDPVNDESGVQDAGGVVSSRVGSGVVQMCSRLRIQVYVRRTFQSLEFGGICEGLGL